MTSDPRHALPHPFGIVIASGNKSPQAVTAFIDSLDPLDPTSLAVTTSSLRELLIALRSDPEVIGHIGDIDEPGVAQEVVTAAVTGHTVCLATTQTFEETLGHLTQAAPRDVAHLLNNAAVVRWPDAAAGA